MGTYVNGQYLPVLGESGYDDEVNDNFRRLGDLGLNVKAHPFNAVGDGVADDTAAFVAMRTAGSHYYIPPGTYLIDPLTAASMQYEHWRGAGRERTKIKCRGSGALFSVASGFNHGNTFEDITFLGTTTAGQKAFVGAGGTTLHAHFFRCGFRDLQFAVDTNATTIETTGLRFNRCEFEDAPLRFTGVAAHNTMTFESCRWSGLTQAVPALEVGAAGNFDVGLVLVDPVFEGLARQAMKLTSVTNVVVLGAYFEFVNTDEAANTPWIDLAAGTFNGVVLHSPYMNSNSAFAHVGIGSSGGASVAGLSIFNPVIVGSLPPTISRSAFLSYTETGNTRGPDGLSSFVNKGQYRGAYFTTDNSAYPVMTIQYGAGSPAAQSIRIQDSSTAVIASVGPLGELRSTAALGTAHVAAATPTGGDSGDIKVGNGKLWVKDGGTWKSVAIS